MVKPVALVTGGAGFIGSHLVDQLIVDGYQVRVIDDLRSGKLGNLHNALSSGNCDIVVEDLLNAEKVGETMVNCELVAHFAANADVRFGWQHPRLDIEQNVLVTQNVLEAMRLTGARQLLFASTGSVYGRATRIPTQESEPFPIQTSLYGASKVSAEALIAAYVEAEIVDAKIYRFVSVLGARYSHGHVIDFVEQLQSNPERLRVLGNGYQRKSYVHISDCISAIMTTASLSSRLEIFNVGTDETCTVRDSLSWICQALSVDPFIEFGIDSQGWVGDNPHIHLDTTKLRSFGWKSTYTIREAIDDTVRYLTKR